MDSAQHTADDGGRMDLWKVDDYQFEDLKFADQKAIALLGISDLIAAAVSYFFANTTALHTPIWGRPLTLAMVIVGNFCAFCATIFAIGVITPSCKLGAKGPSAWVRTAIDWVLFRKRGEDTSDGSLIQWAGIVAGYPEPGDSGAYLKKIRSLKQNDIDQQLANDIHRMARVAWEKYRCINIAVNWATGEFLSLLAGLTLAIVLKYSAAK
jgi:hypothetical protein